MEIEVAGTCTIVGAILASDGTRTFRPAIFASGIFAGFGHAQAFPHLNRRTYAEASAILAVIAQSLEAATLVRDESNPT